MPDQNEPGALRERIAAAILRSAHHRSGLNDAIFLADAVLDALRLEQVGWRWRSIHRDHGPSPWRYVEGDDMPEMVAPNHFTSEYEPVYRLAAARPEGDQHG